MTCLYVFIYTVVISYYLIQTTSSILCSKASFIFNSKMFVI